TVQSVDFRQRGAFCFLGGERAIREKLQLQGCSKDIFVSETKNARLPGEGSRAFPLCCQHAAAQQSQETFSIHFVYCSLRGRPAGPPGPKLGRTSSSVNFPSEFASSLASEVAAVAISFAEIDPS